MAAKILIGFIILAVVTGGAWFLSYYPLNSKQSPANVPVPTQTQTQTTNTVPANVSPVKEINMTDGKTGIDAIKSYAAHQNNIPLDKLVVVSSSEHTWADTCFELFPDNKSCIKTSTHGFEVTFKINGQEMTYRGDDAGKYIRFVKK